MTTLGPPSFFPPPGDQDAGIRDNMDDLRRQLTTRLALLALAVAQLSILFYDPPVRFPLDILFFWASLTGLCGLALRLNDGRPTLARHLLAGGLLLALLLAMRFFPAPWLPFAGGVLIFTNGMLVSGSELVTATAVFATAVILHHTGLRSYPLAGLFTVVSLALVGAWLAVRNLTTSLAWVWQMNQRAEELLNATRTQQAELRRTVKSLQILNDIHARTERELLIVHQQLRASQQLKEQFAANISHELRTPLSIILGFSEVMVLSPEVYGEHTWPPKLMRDVYQIYRNSRHLLDMIDDILDLSRFELVGFTLQKEATPLAPLLHDAANIVADLFDASPDVTFQVILPPDLPILAVDQTRIRQVLLNLLNNARRYTQKGTVTLTAVADTEWVTVQVQDTGVGINAADLENIFTEFYQADYSLSRQHGGAGLGLAICQRFVAAHDGRIWAESEPGVGSTFFFSLPLPAHKPASKPYQTPLPATSKATRPCVLLIEPDPLVVSLVQRHLPDFDIVPTTAAALAAQVNAYHPLAAIYNRPPGPAGPNRLPPTTHIPIIECALPSQSWMAQTLGAVACLTKPINFAQLQREIASLGSVQDVLVIDDSPGICQLVERGLSMMDGQIQVRLAYDGRAGLQAMHTSVPDLVILDLVMPELGGLGVIEAMHAQPALAAVPVILLTATSYVEDSLAQHGAQVTITQVDPWLPGETLRCLDAILKSLKPQVGTHHG